MFATKGRYRYARRDTKWGFCYRCLSESFLPGHFHVSTAPLSYYIPTGSSKVRLGSPSYQPGCFRHTAFCYKDLLWENLEKRHCSLIFEGFAALPSAPVWGTRGECTQSCRERPCVKSHIDAVWQRSHLLNSCLGNVLPEKKRKKGKGKQPVLVVWIKIRFTNFSYSLQNHGGAQRGKSCSCGDSGGCKGICSAWRSRSRPPPSPDGSVPKFLSSRFPSVALSPAWGIAQLSRLATFFQPCLRFN